MPREVKRLDPFHKLFYSCTLDVLEKEIIQMESFFHEHKRIQTDNVHINEVDNTFKVINVLNLPALINLKKQVEEILQQFKLGIKSSWGLRYQKFDTMRLHNHGNEPELKSGIIYLKGRGPGTIFYEDAFRSWMEYSFSPGELLLFSEVVSHEVRPLKENEYRLVISFNTYNKEDHDK
jgi:hypothetical protein|tara:strand:- start:2806 stop:3339 length:534 start_codon:yes stop_codon:yes gene_type:complete